MQSMMRELNDYRNMDHSKYDCFILAILTHGEDNSFHGEVYGVDDNPVQIQDIFSLFSNKNCKTLRGKPKIFFLQACRGSKYGKRTSSLMRHIYGQNQNGCFWFIKNFDSGNLKFDPTSRDLKVTSK